MSNLESPVGVNREYLLAGLRAVIIEDQRLFADFLMHCLSGWGIEVLLLTESGLEGLRAVRARSPDLLLLDFSLPDIDGLEVAQRVLLESPGVRVLGLSQRLDAWTMVRVRRLGLHGFVDKLRQDRVVLREALVEVVSGRPFLSSALQESSTPRRGDPRDFSRFLSDYETRILGLIGEACTDEEIARELAVSPSTVQSRRRDIMRKLDIHSTPKLMLFAIRNGLVRPERLVCP